MSNTDKKEEPKKDANEVKGKGKGNKKPTVSELLA
jgi:hypothetical protein